MISVLSTTRQFRFIILGVLSSNSCSAEDRVPCLRHKGFHSRVLIRRTPLLHRFAPLRFLATTPAAFGLPSSRQACPSLSTPPQRLSASEKGARVLSGITAGFWHQGRLDDPHLAPQPPSRASTKSAVHG
ncbi:hypothetical protein BU25DRAFT_140529 [Macroventuria anomochaeta]|uniref:Uncharacterized protein n=1 Tax=Macroventuria anomochaeta TaxID=301207 RepID=A0ACB6SDK3_9PLEO|nr:uncharacterized protein BU25DRAFT_140529 [Macroventuria anomochaeta]KAF2632119.1 hypothetical protein BU25DRAFT_140529 [Macroventuria anomochaeta]